MKHASLAGLLFIGSVFCASTTPAAKPKPASHQAAQQSRQPPIKSLRELDEYLRKHARDKTAFDGFSAAGRKRFVDSLMFNESGLVGYNYSELKAELSSNDIRRVLGLFGMEASAFLLDNARPSSVGNKPIEAPSRLIEENYALFRQQETSTTRHSDQERTRIVRSQFDALFANEVAGPKLKTANGADLELLFRAANSAAFITPDARHLEVMTRVLEELQARDLALPGHYADMYGAYVQARMFKHASTLSSNHPSVVVENLPTLRETNDAGAGGPTELVVSADRRELTRQPVALDSPARIVVIANPLCHFSQNASRGIKADPALSAIFLRHAKWLAPQDRNLNFDVYQQWNTQNPDQPMTLVYKREEWPMVESWGTPTFYFLKAGKLVAKVEGWPADGRVNELRAALKKAGLL